MAEQSWEAEISKTSLLEPGEIPKESSEAEIQSAVTEEHPVATKGTESGEGKEACNEFTCFPKLPAELRLMVYKEMENILTPPRWFGVAPSVDCEGIDIPPMSVLRMIWEDQQLPDPFSTTVICPEMSKEILPTQIPWHTVKYEPEWADDPYAGLNPLRIYDPEERWIADPKRDYFVFGTHDIQFERYGFDNAAALMSTAIQVEAFGTIQHIAFNFEWLFITSREERATLKAYLSYFSSLKDLTIIVGNDAWSLNLDHEIDRNKFEDAPTATSVTVAGLVKRYAERIFHDKSGESPRAKIPVIRVVFESRYGFPAYRSSYFSDEELQDERCREMIWDDALQHHLAIQYLNRHETSLSESISSSEAEESDIEDA